MCKPVSQSPKSKPISTEERLKNAEHLAKSLNSYLPKYVNTKRLSSRIDKRIYHLNAAHNYILHLEGNIKELHSKLHSQVPEDCCLLEKKDSLANNRAPRVRILLQYSRQPLLTTMLLNLLKLTGLSHIFKFQQNLYILSPKILIQQNIYASLNY